MALPSSGSISLSQVAVELGRSSTATTSLGESAVRTLFGVASGAISMSQGYGKANQFSFTISSNQTGANLRTLAEIAGWNGTSKVIATINSGVYLSALFSSIGGLTIDGSFPNGVELTNNGFIVGVGGNGGKGGRTDAFYSATAGTAGGLALRVLVPVTLRNNGTIAGGGGGGGGSAAFVDEYFDGKQTIYTYYAGGGGGGGRSGNINSAGGSPGPYNGIAQAGFPGTPSGAGIGGNSAAGNITYVPPGGTGVPRGGTGGDWGANGSNGYRSAFWGFAEGVGGSGGAAITGNSNITYLATGTRLGAIS